MEKLLIDFLQEQFSIVGKYEDDKSKVCISFLRKIEELLDSVGNF